MKKKSPLNRFRKRSASSEPLSRITNETVAEHRERILAGGRRYKYPIQYARHKLVINAILITIAALILLIILGWWQLYIAQNSSSFIYRLTQLFPVPVASVDGEPVRFSNYLIQYRGSEYYLSKYDEIKMDSRDGKTQLARIKRESLTSAEEDAYAGKLARQNNVTVSEKDIDAVIDQQRNTANGRISQETYDASSRMLYDWSPEDYRSAVRRSILRARVSFAVDKKADDLQKKAADLIKTNNGDLTKVAEQLGDVGNGRKAAAQTTGLVNSASTLPGVGISMAEVAKLPTGTVSDVMKSSTDDGYYFVKVLEKNDKQASFAFIHIPLTEFTRQFDQLKKDGKIKEYISVPEVSAPQQ